jgi:hypothetical protein
MKSAANIFGTLAACGLLCLAAVACIDELRPDTRVLYDFETDRDLDRVLWTCHTVFTRSTTHKSGGDYALRADLPAGRFPGITFLAVPRDWTGYESLHIWVYYEGEAPADAVLRVDDVDHGDDYGNRANVMVKIQPGVNRLTFPLEELKKNPIIRNLELNEILRLIFFFPFADSRNTIYVDDVVLKRSQ